MYSTHCWINIIMSGKKKGKRGLNVQFRASAVQVLQDGGEGNSHRRQYYFRDVEGWGGGL
jgi:hypothetical protein